MVAGGTKTEHGIRHMLGVYIACHTSCLFTDPVPVLVPSCSSSHTHGRKRHSSAGMACRCAGSRKVKAGKQHI